MPSCPNCNYKLVLLPKRKYKCAKCSKLFLQKSTEDKDFQNWNKNQRRLDEHNLNLENNLSKSLKPKLTEEDKKKYRLEYYSKNKEKFKKYTKNYFNKNKEKSRIRCKKYYETNKDKIIANKKSYYKKAKDKINATKKLYKLNNLERFKMLARIRMWRNKQKEITLQFIENSFSEPLNQQLWKVLPTKLLAELLNN